MTCEEVGHFGDRKSPNTHTNTLSPRCVGISQAWRWCGIRMHFLFSWSCRPDSMMQRLSWKSLSPDSLASPRSKGRGCGVEDSLPGNPSLAPEAEALADLQTRKKSQETGATGQTSPASRFSGDWHRPAIAWLMFSLFCIQIVAHEICFVLLFFFYPLAT